MHSGTKMINAIHQSVTTTSLSFTFLLPEPLRLFTQKIITHMSQHVLCIKSVLFARSVACKQSDYETKMKLLRVERKYKVIPSRFQEISSTCFQKQR